MTDVRLNRADRRQVRLEAVDLETLVPSDHRVRAIWAFVEGLDLSVLHDGIKSRGTVAGRPAIDPMILLALWLYATADGVGSARALARLCEHHTIYRWLCGAVSVSHATLSGFRVENGAFLDTLMSTTLAALIQEGLLDLDEVITDGTKVRASASKGSLRREASLREIEAKVAERIRTLKAALDGDSASGERSRAVRAKAAAEAQAARVAAALSRLEEHKAERARWAAAHPGAAATTPKSAPRVSTTDAEARMMRMADDAMRPCFNVQIATACGFVVAVKPTSQCNDHDLAGEMIAEVQRVCGGTPCRLLADTGAMTQADIVRLAAAHPALVVYAPPVAERPGASPASQNRRARNLAKEPACLKEWRARMATPQAETIYARRPLTEHVHAKIKNRGFGRMLVRGLARVRCVCLLHSLTHNLLHALTRRAALAAA